MLFNSYFFIFAFLPLTLLGWYGLNRIGRLRGAQAFLTVMSLWFYAYFNAGYLALILTSCLFNYLLSFALMRAQKRGAAFQKRARRAVGSIGCLLNLGLLGYFKYYDFLIENINAVCGADFNLKHILLPLGISFFTFQQLSFLIDRCRGNAPHYPILDYLTFVTFFPQLIAGPIVLHSELVPQFQDPERRKPDPEKIARGIAFFVIGLSKKVLLADLLAKPADFGFANVDGLDSVSLALAALAYMFQLYFDFSGYCDMAVGLGYLFGIELPDNFDSPYQAVSIRDFWRRWHKTLGRFFTAYVYIPLGGSRRGRARTALNTMIVFTLSGLWHGANWTFVVWGMLHGLAMVFHSFFPVDEKDGKRHLLGHTATLVFHYLSLIIFRSDTLADAVRYLKRLFSMTYFHSLQAVAGAMETPELYAVEKLFSVKAPQLVAPLHIAAFLSVTALGAFLLTRKNARRIIEGGPLSAGFAGRLALLFVWSVISLSGVSTFLYFNF